MTIIDLNDIDITAEDTPAAAVTVDQATARQLDFIAKLAEGKALDEVAVAFVGRAKERIDAETLTKVDASRAIDYLIRFPWKPREVKAPAAEPGTFHMLDGTVYRVKESRNGRAYAERFDADAVAWAYAKGSIFKLSADTKITAEQAAEIGHITNHCVFCSRELTHPDSVAVGYGPICAGHHGLPWGL